MRKLKVDESAEGVRADIFVASKLPKFSRSSLSRLFKLNKVRVGRVNIKSGRRLHKTDVVVIDDRLLKTPPAKVNLPITYEDNTVIVINKPPGLLSHSKGAINDEPTVASALRSKISPKLTGNRAGIVHRLDRGTSGVMVVAKNKEALAYLQKQFSGRSTKKTYMAIVQGSPKPPEAIIDIPIGRNPKKPQTFTAVTTGKPAQTHYKVLKKIKRAQGAYSIVELKPITGRTHQLRVHLAYIGHPIIGDGVYGNSVRGSTEPIMLHAKTLSLVLPSGQSKTFTAPLPIVFKKFLDEQNE